MKYLCFIMCFVFLFSAEGCARNGRTEYAVPFFLESLDGSTVDSSDYFGKEIVFLNFWATGCDACKEEVPYLKGFYSKYKDKIAIFAVDIGESKTKLQSFKKSHAINYPILMDKNAQVAISYGVSGIPAIAVIGKDKKIAYYGHSIPEAENTIKFLLKR
ncbi:MAG: redoxin domain-containing protein [Candidatus Omnitrophota bacterium]